MMWIAFDHRVARLQLHHGMSPNYKPWNPSKNDPLFPQKKTLNPKWFLIGLQTFCSNRRGTLGLLSSGDWKKNAHLFLKSTNFWGANNPGVPWLPACHGCCFFKKKLGGFKTPGLPKEITSNSKWFWRCPKSWDTQRVSHISWSIHLFGGKKRTPSPYSLRRNLPSWLKSPKKKLANMLARCSSSFHPPPCNQQNIASKCQFFDAPLPLCPPGNSVYFPHCTGCVKPRWATCASDDIILKKKHFWK